MGLEDNIDNLQRTIIVVSKTDQVKIQKPKIRLKSLSTLLSSQQKQIMENCHETGKGKGVFLRKALRRTLSQSTNSNEYTDVVNVFESIVNKKLTGENKRYFEETKSYPNSSIHEHQCNCHECDMISNRTPSMFGKVYPSANERTFNSANRNDNIIFKISAELENENTTVIDIPESNLNKQYSNEITKEASSMVPSIFGKVYVKKPVTHDLDFFRKKETSLDIVKKLDENTEMNNSLKRKRDI